ncbi:hypothetical protein [Bacteroides sp. 51]|uniref:hypothetical protein n=1 Tax=Bacteroides sp. 51 TaxID=2302938 RepID=UPI0013D3D245|nr:hypothetical protein [Bacteroides sp. 51]NDV84885.1 hypothetical protein [Bacteroides sp. 51]
MKPITINEEIITEELIAQLQAEELQKIEQETYGISREASIEYRMAKYAALNVDFIETAEEMRLYTDAIYGAICWGQNVR